MKTRRQVRCRAFDRSVSPTTGNHDRPCRAPRRSGVATVWLIAFGPAFLLTFIMVTDIANVWLARIELVNAVESGALAGAKVWGDGADNGVTRSAARVAAQNFTQANTVLQNTFTIGTNDDGGGGNLTCDGNVLLGRIAGGTVLDASAATMAGVIVAGERGVRVSATISITSLWIGRGPYSVQANATARFDTSTVPGTPRLASLTSITCP